MAKFSVLKNHAQSTKHAKASGKESPPDSAFDLTKHEENERKEVAKLELKIIGFMTRLNISFKNAPLVVQFLKSLNFRCDNLDTWDNVRIGATKARDLCVNLISDCEKLRIAKTLQDTQFFVSMDETTDVKQDKNVVIEARYTDPIDNEVKTAMWEDSKVFEEGEIASSGAERLTNIVLESFQKFRVPTTNILGIVLIIFLLILNI